VLIRNRGDVAGAADVDEARFLRVVPPLARFLVGTGWSYRGVGEKHSDKIYNILKFKSKNNLYIFNFFLILGF